MDRHASHKSHRHGPPIAEGGVSRFSSPVIHHHNQIVPLHQSGGYGSAQNQINYKTDEVHKNKTFPLKSNFLYRIFLSFFIWLPWSRCRVTHGTIYAPASSHMCSSTNHFFDIYFVYCVEDLVVMAVGASSIPSSFGEEHLMHSRMNV